MSTGEVITRPDGRLYHPRRVVAYVTGEDAEGVLVLGTHDLARAQILADQVAEQAAGTGFTAVDPRTGWWRDGFEYGQRAWVADEVRGRAGVWFTEIVERTPAGLMP